MIILHATTGQVRGMLQRAHQLGLSRAAQLRLRWFEYALRCNASVSKTCRHFGIARSTFLRWARRFDPRLPDTLEDASRRPRTVRAPQEDAAAVSLIRSYRSRYPMMGKEVIREHLEKEHGCRLSSSTIGRIIDRHGFFFANTPAHRRKRREYAERCDPGERVVLPLHERDAELSFYSNT